jgi:hypothetical protein
MLLHFLSQLQKVHCNILRGIQFTLVQLTLKINFTSTAQCLMNSTMWKTY